MPAASGLRAPLSPRAVHLCIDMQRIFTEEGPWPTPWMKRVLPVVIELVKRFPERTLFTRFITPERAEEMPGCWRRYYERWRETTREHLDARLLDLVPGLAHFVPPEAVFDKMTYSAFAGRRLHPLLREREVDTLIITGSETDVCVAATVLGAVDHGYRVVLVENGLCSSSDSGHDSQLEVYRTRFSEQIETADAETILSAWSR